MHYAFQYRIEPPALRVDRSILGDTAAGTWAAAIFPVVSLDRSTMLMPPQFGDFNLQTRYSPVEQLTELSEWWQPQGIAREWGTSKVFPISERFPILQPHCLTV